MGGLVVAPAVWAASDRPLRDLPLVGPGSPVAYLSRNYELAIRQYGVLDTFATTTPYGRLLGGSSPDVSRPEHEESRHGQGP